MIKIILIIKYKSSIYRYNYINHYMINYFIFQFNNMYNSNYDRWFTGKIEPTTTLFTFDHKRLWLSSEFDFLLLQIKVSTFDNNTKTYLSVVRENGETAEELLYKILVACYHNQKLRGLWCHWYGPQIDTLTLYTEKLKTIADDIYSSFENIGFYDPNQYNEITWKVVQCKDKESICEPKITNIIKQFDWDEFKNTYKTINKNSNIIV